MTHEAAKVEDLIRETVGSFVEHPHALEFTCIESADGNAHWKMKCDPKDERSIIGESGYRIKALIFLVRTLGLSRGKHYRFDFVATEKNPTRCV